MPIHTISNELILKILNRNKVDDDNIEKILNTIKKQKQIAEKIMEENILEDEITELTKEEFENYPPTLSLSGCFYKETVNYNYEEYLEHLSDTQITIHPGEWVMISKNTHPAIHFVIHHPKLRSAIENFIAPVVE